MKTACLCLCLLSFCAAADLNVANLRCEQLINPLGIDAREPRLNWNLESQQRPQELRAQTQTAYQILVASSREALVEGRGDLWDSGKVESDQCIQVAYAGAPLASHAECWWKVRVWDQDGKESAWSEPARWTMGILDPAEWKAQWIGLDDTGKPAEEKAFQQAKWIWFPEGEPAKSAPVAKRYFRRIVEIPAGSTVDNAVCEIVADNKFVLFVNGQKSVDGGMGIIDAPVAKYLNPGRNVIAIEAENFGDNPNPAGLLAQLEIKLVGGKTITVGTDASWKSSDTISGGAWLAATFDDSAWKPAKELGPYAMEPWAGIRKEEVIKIPARMLRKNFEAGPNVKRATAYMSGLGLSELYVNGQKVSDDVLSPGLTEYNKRVFYVTRDVTPLLKEGVNAVGVWLGNGRYYAPRIGSPTATRTYGFPKLLFHLRIEYADGTVREVVSDTSWKLTTDGPIRTNCEYDGETYDARLQLEGWNTPEFNDSTWQNAKQVDSPGGVMSAQMIEPIKVVETLKPIGRSNPAPGVYIFDMGQNMVGWCRIKVEAPSGTTVSLRHAETIRDDGTLYLDNIRGAKVTDLYTCAGGGVETYEPRFTYHGFRFVEVTGWPGEPPMDAIEGRVVHDAVPQAGTFTCSNQVLNNIYHNIVWGVSGNYRSISTDCPQRDERQGWLGDRSEESRGEGYLHDISALYAKWVCDMHDAQKDSGSVSDVCPSYWPLYNDNVTWPSTFIIVPNMLYEQYGDMRVIERHYDGLKKWIDHMSGYIKDDIISKDNYGDWCVPPEEQSLIHSKDPLRKTPAELLATSYFYHDLGLMARYAGLLGKADDKAEFLALAERLKTAFNKKFLDRDKAVYGNGSQTSQVLPLAYGMVPPEYKDRVFNYLVDKIMVEGKGHIGTGLIGGQWLNRVLSDNGRPDVAYTIAGQTDYPSWGYMIEKGATTIWELWNGDTADPAMNSHNHVMLVGDLGIWMYEYLGGIRPDLERALAFKRITLKPTLVPGLEFVKATYQSQMGPISSEWKRDGASLVWNFSIPANTVATVYVPAKDAASVTESGKPMAEADGVEFLRMENGAAVFEAGSGTYSVTAK